jgi:branched-chain amino acid transport system permease protein
MTGMLYSLVALGFVLIFKASGVFNFAQGAMVLFAALAMARFCRVDARSCSAWTARCWPTCWPSCAAMAVMVAVAWLIERLVLGKLVNQEGITLLMATLGITYFLDGFGQTCSAATSTRSTSACPRTRCSCSRTCSRAACWSTRKTCTPP